jgi:hypothetical protein
MWKVTNEKVLHLLNKPLVLPCRELKALHSIMWQVGERIDGSFVNESLHESKTFDSL